MSSVSLAYSVARHLCTSTWRKKNGIAQKGYALRDARIDSMAASPGRRRCSGWRCVKAFVAILLVLNRPVFAYSVQTHELLIDLNWNRTIRPFLLARFPHATAAELEAAHAYAFGGCAIQDLGYYPFSNQFFSNLTHYVRSADFIQNLFKQAKNPNELAFAIGALSHYVGDSIGHSEAVNAAVAIEFPKLARKYGPRVTYDENPHAHVRTEFAFDVNQISKHRM